MALLRALGQKDRLWEFLGPWCGLRLWRCPELWREGEAVGVLQVCGREGSQYRCLGLWHRRQSVGIP